MSELTLGRAGLCPSQVVAAAELAPTPFYIYDEAFIRARCKEMLAMPNAYGLLPRFAMKANSSRALLQIVHSEGFGIDASSLNEAKRAVLAGIAPEKILLTTQEVPRGQERKDLEALMLRGLKYNACSLEQLREVAPFAAANGLSLGVRVHPGVGSGESVTRNTGDKYSCFGVHLSNLEEALTLAHQHGVTIDLVHVHIGSGGEPEAWRENIKRELGFIEEHFPDTISVNFGGGFKVARMSDETPADIQDLGRTAKAEVEAFFTRTGRKLRMEVEPGNYLMANSGYLVSSVMDIKQTGPDGFTFVVVNGGMEVITRPLLYGARHPFSVLSADGRVLSDEFQLDAAAEGASSAALEELIVVGRCCESGDSLTLDEHHHIVPRRMALPEIGGYLVVGGAGAYCASMTPFNYNSHVQAAEFLLRQDGSIRLIRARQNMEQLTQNERDLE
jgi:diaminopimelate decarboxylase